MVTDVMPRELSLMTMVLLTSKWRTSLLYLPVTFISNKLFEIGYSIIIQRIVKTNSNSNDEDQFALSGAQLLECYCLLQNKKAQTVRNV